MSADLFKSLCVELVELSAPTDSIPQLAERLQKLSELASRARAAQPALEPPMAPTDEELLEAASNPLGYVHIRVDSKELEANGEELIAYARAVLARWGNPPTTLDRRIND
jgi:hypothetical protein